MGSFKFGSMLITNLCVDCDRWPPVAPAVTVAVATWLWLNCVCKLLVFCCCHRMALIEGLSDTSGGWASWCCFNLRWLASSYCSPGRLFLRLRLLRCQHGGLGWRCLQAWRTPKGVSGAEDGRLLAFVHNMRGVCRSYVTAILSCYMYESVLYLRLPQG